MKNALEKLKRLGSYDVVLMDDLRRRYPARFTPTGAMDHEWFERDIRPHYHVYVRLDKHSLSFTLQDGPVQEVGVNGCQVDELIDAAAQLIALMDHEHPCQENKEAWEHLQHALASLEERRCNRVLRGVEGTYSP